MDDTRLATSTIDPESVEGLNRDETRSLYREIFVEQEYLPPDFDIPAHGTVVDVGANIGMFALFAHTKWPTAQVLAFEPVTPIFAALRTNLARFGVPGRAYNVGLSNREQTTDFTYFPEYSTMSTRASYADVAAEKSLVRASMTAGDENGDLAAVVDEMLDWRFREVTERCRLRPMSTVLDENAVERIDLLKIDVQRAEADVLDGIDERHWTAVQAITMELHDDPDGWTAGRAATVSRRLTDRGFTVSVDQPANLSGSDRLTLWACRS